MTQQRKSDGSWVKEPTAILVIHGIGQQNPLETIDQFGRTLVSSLSEQLKCKLQLSHRLSKKTSSNKLDVWFDNFLRIERIENGQVVGDPIDVYEFYWAHYTEDQATLTDISKWVSEVTSGAKKFYRENAELGKKYKDSSAFFSNKKFRFWKYNLLIHLIGGFIPALTFFIEQGAKVVAYIPIVGIPFRWFVTWLADTKMKQLANVIGDITIYNTVDQKCKFYRIRQEILNGAVKAIRYLIEPDKTNSEKPNYGKVLIAGHSLGSQVSYDAINRLIHLANANELEGFENDTDKLSKVMCGLVTFGSPLDKIAFFLRENVPANQYIRLQLLNNFHSFKQRDWVPEAGKAWLYPIKPVFKRLLEEMTWINFFDKRDYVSGSLDYYRNLENVDMQFKSNIFSFTHSNYWTSEKMFNQIISTYLVPGKNNTASSNGTTAKNAHIPETATVLTNP